jgi:ubiquinol-cytochrome c reductase cytochrome c subunit
VRDRRDSLIEPRGAVGSRPRLLSATGGVVALAGSAFALTLFVGTPSSKASPPSAAAPSVSLSDARTTYLRDCATCHGSDARGTDAGPSLQGVGTAAVDYWVSTGRMPLYSNVRSAKSPANQPPPGQQLADPTATPARHRPWYSPEMIAGLVAYVATIAPGGPQIPHVDLQHASLATGGQVYREQCAACHSWSGVGGALYQRAAPTLHLATPTQIAEAMRTGPAPMPVFGTAAVPNSTLDDVVAYVRYLDNPTNRGGAPLWYLGPVAEGAVAIILGLGLLLVVIRWIGTRG